MELTLVVGDLIEIFALLLVRPGLLARSLDRLSHPESGTQGNAPQILTALEEGSPRSLEMTASSGQARQGTTSLCPDSR